ncbi:hypothetical protein GQ607_016699, partial [Colletotrichum asianum]
VRPFGTRPSQQERAASAGNLKGLKYCIDLVFHAKFRYCQSLVGLVICAVGNRMPVQEVSLFRAIPNRGSPTTSSRPFQIILPQALSGCHGTSSTVPPIQVNEICTGVDVLYLHECLVAEWNFQSA